MNIPCGRVMGHGESCSTGYLCDSCQALSRMQWISVADRLPDLDAGRVLICDGRDQYVGYFHGNGWSGDNPEEGFTMGEITHWMPLAEPPK